MTVVRLDLTLPGGRRSHLAIGEGAWEGIPRHLGLRPPSGVALLADEAVFRILGGRIVPLLAAGGSPPGVHLVPPGEASKTFDELARACRFLAGRGLARDSLVAVLGGGVAGDLGGLAAALYLRGVRLVQLPTTLLAMVDSSVGGKNAVNLPEGKNLVGTFHQPEAVFADTRALATLPEAEWYSGMAEVVKTALTLDLSLLPVLEKGGIAPGSSFGGGRAGRVVAACCRAKADVVAADERERGWRRVLNFGHTLAHALEAVGGYGTLSHGQAVVEGMKAALVLSRDLAGLPPGGFARARALLLGFPPAPRFPGGGEQSAERLAPFLARDKKAEGGKVTAVLLSDLGRPVFHPLSDPLLLVRAWEKWGKIAGD